MSSFGVVLDANVIILASLRDTLLRNVEKGLFRLHWTEEILEEVRRNLVSIKQIKMPEDKAAKLIQILKEEFEEAIIEPVRYQHLIPSMQNNEKDRHVLAATIASNSQVIVTFNLKDFPAAVLDPFNIQAQLPDTFLVHQFSLFPLELVEIIEEQAAALKNHKTPQELLETLYQHTPNFVEMIRPKLKPNLAHNKRS